MSHMLVLSSNYESHVVVLSSNYESHVVVLSSNCELHVVVLSSNYEPHVVDIKSAVNAQCPCIHGICAGDTCDCYQHFTGPLCAQVYCGSGFCEVGQACIAGTQCKNVAAV